MVEVEDLQQLREVAMRMRALAGFARLVGMSNWHRKMTLAEQTAASNVWHTKFVRALQ